MIVGSPGQILVRRPGFRLADGLVTHIERQSIDLGLAAKQWDAYIEAFREHGWHVTEVEPEDTCADAVFIEDALVVFDDIIVITNPGAPARQPEIAGAVRTLSSIGLRGVAIENPGTLDGGDVLKVGRTVYVGRSLRTNEAGIDQLDSLLTLHGWTVVTVPLTKVLHLKSAVTALPDGTIIGWMPAVDDPSLFPSLLAMPEESGAHVVDLGGATVLMSNDCPRSVELIRERGYEVRTVDISEFIKLEGCVTCLSVRIRSHTA
jgi:dimethylargininase